MAKYRVMVPKPSAKRLVANGKVIVTYRDGWEDGSYVQHGEPDMDIHELAVDAAGLEFEVADRYEWLYSNQVIDGWSFEVKAEYKNSTGSRVETFKLVPEKIS